MKIRAKFWEQSEMKVFFFLITFWTRKKYCTSSMTNINNNKMLNTTDGFETNMYII